MEISRSPGPQTRIAKRSQGVKGAAGTSTRLAAQTPPTPENPHGAWLDPPSDPALRCRPQEGQLASDCFYFIRRCILNQTPRAGMSMLGSAVRWTETLGGVAQLV